LNFNLSVLKLNQKQEVFLMLVQALLIGIWAGLAGIDLFDLQLHIHRPVVTGLVVGIILGDVKTGLVAGGMLELVWMGMVPLAGAQPPNVVIGGIIGTAFAIFTKEDPNIAVGVAVPFAIAAQAGITLLFTVFSPVMHKADEYAANADTRGIERINYLGLLILFCSYFVVAFLPIFFGEEAARSVVQMLPEKLIGGLSVAGGMMPAVGFGMLLKIMLKKEFAGFLILGFVLAAFLKLEIMAIAFIGLSIAMYDYYLKKDKSGGIGGGNTEAKEEYSDGI
jgi:PTS system N-acetylgalactosamine-specific IIC component